MLQKKLVHLFLSISVLLLFYLPASSQDADQKEKSHDMGMMQHGQMMQDHKMMDMTDMMKKMHAVNEKTDAMLNHMHDSMEKKTMQQMQSDHAMMMTHNMDDMAKHMTKFMENMQKMMQDNSMMNNQDLKQHLKQMQVHMNVITEQMESMTTNLEAVNKEAGKKHK